MLEGGAASSGSGHARVRKAAWAVPLRVSARFFTRALKLRPRRQHSGAPAPQGHSGSEDPSDGQLALASPSVKRPTGAAGCCAADQCLQARWVLGAAEGADLSATMQWKLSFLTLTRLWPGQVPRRSDPIHPLPNEAGRPGVAS